MYLGEKLTTAVRGYCGSFRYGVLESVGVVQMLRSNSLHTVQEWMGSFLRHMQCSADACGLLWLRDMNKTKPVPSSFAHNLLEMEGAGAGFAACLRGSACSYLLHPGTLLPESWVNLLRHPGLDFIPPMSFLKHDLVLARPAPFPGSCKRTVHSSQGIATHL